MFNFFPHPLSVFAGEGGTSDLIVAFPSHVFYLTGFSDGLVSLLIHLCPKELSAVPEMFSLCTVQYSSHWLHVATEYLKCGQCH